VLTWYTVVDTLRPEVALAEFLVGQAPVLVAGFGLTAFGAGLAVSSYDRADTDLIAGWCAAGTLSMGAVVALTSVGGGVALSATAESRLVANVLVGGAVGGALTGVRTAATRRHRRDVSRKADRLTVLNRLLRHEVLNKVNVVAGYAATDDDRATDPLAVIRRNAVAIGETVDRVGALTGSDPPESVDLAACVDDAVRAVRERHPDATVVVGDRPSVTVRGTPQFDALFDHLVESAVIRSAGAVRVRVDVVDDAAAGEARVRVVSDGGPLSAAEGRIVEGRAIPERDDPRSGFGLSVARLLAEEVGGSLHAETDGEAVAMVVTLPRAGEVVGATPTRLRHAALAALVAGGAMGLLVGAVSGKLPVIGALYGVANVRVGWVTHLFHSVCFGFLFVAATATWTADDPWTLGALGAGYGAVLWLVAAGVVMPLWLRAAGVPAPVPNLALPSLGSHLVWGVVFGGGYGWLCRRA
jgi:signal transduction histidine kinase